MEQKTKFIIIGLAGLAMIFLVLFLGSFNSKQSLTRERNDLRKENTALSGQLGKMQDSLRGYENKIESLNKQLSEISIARDDLQRKYELANSAKEELIEKLKSQQERPSAAGFAALDIPPGTDAYWASILKQKTDLEMQLDAMSNELKSTIITNEQLQREKSGLELDIKNLRHESEDLKRQLDYNKKLMDSLAQELVREKNDKMQIQDGFKDIRNENTVLTRQLKGLNNRKVNLERKIQEFNEEKSALRRRVDELETMFKEKLAQVSNLNDQLDAVRSGAVPQASKKEPVTLPAIVVKPSGKAEEQAVDLAGVEGKVVAINRENNFVIIDLGENHDIKVGDFFHIYRGDEVIADIVVIQTRSTISACDIKKETDAIKIGDTVR